MPNASINIDGKLMEAPIEWMHVCCYVQVLCGVTPGIALKKAKVGSQVMVYVLQLQAGYQAGFLPRTAV